MTTADLPWETIYESTKPNTNAPEEIHTWESGGLGLPVLAALVLLPVHMAFVPLSLRSKLALVLLVLAVSWHAWWVTRGWNIPGLSGHEFRQTQTAVTIRAIKEDGFRLDYPTPILGKPWSIPFEFPTYQGLVAFVSDRTGLGLIESGRWVSVIMFYLALPAFVLLLRRAGFSPIASVLGMTPVLFAPVYILYSRSLMIESTALCASAWFLYLLMGYRAKRTPVLLAATLIVGALAAVTKGTTWAVFCLPWAACFFAEAWRARKGGWRAMMPLLDDVVLVGLPLLAVGIGWVWMTDQIKLLNPIGGFLTSTNLREFNFGTWAQHWDLQVWKSLWKHWNVAVMPWWGIVASGIGLVFAPVGRRVLWVLGLGVFFAAQFLFINLYAIHDYYFYANAWAACMAVGSVAAAIWDSNRHWLARTAPALVLLVVVWVGQYHAYRREFFNIQTSPRSASFGLADAIKHLTQPDDVIVVQAPDWSSILPFFAERRMLMIPDSQMYLREDAVRQSIALLEDESVPLVIFRGETRRHADWLIDRIEDFRLSLFPLFTWQDEAAVYARRADYPRLRAMLENIQFSDVVPQPVNGLPPLSPPVSIVNTPGWEEIPNMEPRPHSGYFPYGINFRYIEGKKALFFDPPTELHFEIPANATQLEFGFQVAPEAFEQKDFDGAYVFAEMKEENRSPTILAERIISRNGPREMQQVVVRLPESKGSTVVLRTLAGPANDSAYDWIVLNYVWIR